MINTLNELNMHLRHNMHNRICICLNMHNRTYPKQIIFSVIYVHNYIKPLMAQVLTKDCF
jgi:hypothetical protein